MKLKKAEKHCRPLFRLSASCAIFSWVIAILERSEGVVSEYSYETETLVFKQQESWPMAIIPYGPACSRTGRQPGGPISPSHQTKSPFRTHIC